LTFQERVLRSITSRTRGAGFGSPVVYTSHVSRSPDQIQPTKMFVFEGLTSEQVVTWILDFLNDEGRGDTQELILALDGATAPDQGTTQPTAVVVLHCTNQGKFRVGVIEYNPDDVLPVSWRNAWWRNAMAETGQVLSRLMSQQIPRGQEK